MRAIVVAGIVGSLGVLMLVGCLGVYFSMPTIVNSLVAEKVLLENDTVMMEKWQNIPLPVYLNVYMFNVTNADEIVKDPENTKPNLEEVGPYIFKVIRKREILDRVNETMTYSEKRIYIFEPSLSNNLDLSDEFTMVNLPIIAADVKAVLLDYFLKMGAFGVSTDELKQLPPFHQCTAQKFLFDGCFNPIMGNLLTYAQQEVEGLQIAPLINETEGKHYEYGLNTGKKDVNSLGHLFKWKRPGKPNFQFSANNVWGGDKYCGHINGTDGTTFPPNLQQKDPLYVFVQDVCRSFEMEAKESIYFKGFNGFRYSLSPKLFQSVAKNPDNHCFCNDKKLCFPYDGILEIGMCKGGIPMTASNPHFLGADEIFLKHINGLSPNAEKHEMIIDVEPYIGIPMRIAKRIQLNIDMTNVKGDLLPAVKNIPKIMFPVFWMDENASLTPELVAEINELLYNKLFIAYIVLYILFAIGGILILSSLCCFFSRKKEESDDIPLQMKGRFSQKM